VCKPAYPAWESLLDLANAGRTIAPEGLHDAQLQFVSFGASCCLLFPIAMLLHLFGVIQGLFGPRAGTFGLRLAYRYRRELDAR